MIERSLKSIQLVIDRNALWFWFSWLNLGEDGGDWLKDFEGSSNETWLSSFLDLTKTTKPPSVVPAFVGSEEI